MRHGKDKRPIPRQKRIIGAIVCRNVDQFRRIDASAASSTTASSILNSIEVASSAEAPKNSMKHHSKNRNDDDDDDDDDDNDHHQHGKKKNDDDVLIIGIGVINVVLRSSSVAGVAVLERVKHAKLRSTPITTQSGYHATTSRFDRPVPYPLSTLSCCCLPPCLVSPSCLPCR